MILTKQDGWGNDRTTQQIANVDAEDIAFSFAPHRPDDDCFVIRFVDKSEYQPPIYSAYWLTFTKDEARQMAKFIKRALAERAQELKAQE